jgi:uncharacterized protein YqgC (DUF456 family)
MDVLGYLLLAAGMLIGVAIIPLGLPGAALILACILVYALMTDFNGGISVWLFVFLCIVTVVAETADNWLTALGARRYGASRAAMWLSFLGGLVGAIFLGSLAAFVLGPLGPVAGGIIGAFLSVVAYEYYRRRDLRESLRAGWGTFLGRMAGIALKLVLAIAMIVAVILSITAS